LKDVSFAAPSRVSGAAPGLRALLILVATGVVLWAAGVALLRWLAAMDWLTGGAHLIVYALIIIGTVPLVPVGRLAAGLPPSETARSVTTVSITALLIDGVVIGWFPWIYSPDEATARLCAGALLWGVGVALALGQLMQPGAR
jgi:hypothetical protein